MIVGNTRAASGGNQPILEPMPNKGSVQYKRLVTAVSGGSVFIRRLKVVRYKYQKCQWKYQDGKRKLVILKTLKRKPRGKQRCG